MRKIRTILITASLLVATLFAIGLGPATEHVDARSDIRAAWEATYPASSSFTKAGCQLCHLNASGGNGWNAYGWSIREGLRDQGLSVQEAIDAVALATADADGNSIPNINEINGNAQPGWRAGATNSVYFDDGSVQMNQTAPTGIGTLDEGTATLPNPNDLAIFLPFVSK